MAKKGSRLTRTLEHQSKKQLYIFIAATILILTTLGIFSTKILDIIGSFMISDQDNSANQEETIKAITPPHFANIPKATETGVITISGNVSEVNGTIEIFVNNRKAVTQTIEEKTSFTIQNISLNEGENIIKGRYVFTDRKSAFTKDYIVHYTTEAPKIEDISPNDGSEFKRGDQEIEVKGKTDPQNTVTVNDFRAIVGTNGDFSYFLRLNEGDNTIKVTATSPTGKETVKEITVSYRP